jgi:hypothetical protein
MIVGAVYALKSGAAHRWTVESEPAVRKRMCRRTP